LLASGLDFKLRHYRTRDALWQEVGRLLDAFTPRECSNYFAATGYEPE